MSTPWDYVYLASRSPRRRELLAQIGVEHRPLEVDVDEGRDAREPPEDYVLRLAGAKAAAGWARVEATDPRPVLGADTAVVVDGTVLGKPADRAHALRMLALLSDREHRVYSAVGVAVAGTVDTRLSVSRVRFEQLTMARMQAYWASGEPRDKAGAYAIQGRGAAFVAHLEGSHSGVVGLPLYETAALLEAAGCRLWWHPA